MRSIRLDSQHVEHRERRSEPRFPAVDNASEVGWWEGLELRVTAAQLMDVSREGLLVLVDQAPSGDGLVLVRLVAPELSDWVEAQLIESRETRVGPYQLRLVFRDAPPRDFLERAIARLNEDEGEGE
jgi:hypothetical protein